MRLCKIPNHSLQTFSIPSKLLVCQWVKNSCQWDGDSDAQLGWWPLPYATGKMISFTSGQHTKSYWKWTIEIVDLPSSKLT